MDPPLRLTAHDLACLRGGRQVFAGVSFALAGGDIMLVTGPNGAGKSSLLRIVAGLLRPASGRLLLEGGTKDASIAEQAHYVGHQDALKPTLSVAENLAFWTTFLGGGGEVMSALAVFDLAPLARLPAAYLSAGQRRRLSLARLAAIKRPIWLLDEPMSALDQASQARLVELMRRHRDRGGLAIVAAHGPIGLAPAHELRLGPT